MNTLLPLTDRPGLPHRAGWRSAILLAVAAFALSGCAITVGGAPDGADATASRGPGPADYLSADFILNNWEVTEREVGPNLVHIGLRKHRLAIGGDGEALQIIRQRSAALAASAGMPYFELIEYGESVESRPLGSRRITSALVRLTAEPRWVLR